MRTTLWAPVLALASLAVCMPATAQTPDPCATAPTTCATTIETRATSDTRIPNTVVDIAVGVTATGKDMAEVQRNLTTQTNQLTAYLRNQQVQRLQTSGLSFHPQTRYDKSGPDKLVGYEGSSRLTFRTTPDKSGDILAGVLTNGANAIQSTTFTPTEQEIDTARKKLSGEATKAAIAEADSVANAAGMKVVAIRSINVDTGAAMIRPMPMMAMAIAKAAPAGPIDTESGEQQLSVTVNITAAATH